MQKTFVKTFNTLPLPEHKAAAALDTMQNDFLKVNPDYEVISNSITSVSGGIGACVLIGTLTIRVLPTDIKINNG